MTLTASSSRNSHRIGLSLLLAGLAGACASSKDVTGSIEPAYDYRDRHPIVITSAEEVLDLYLRSSRTAIDRRQADDVAAFSRNYREHGRGPVTVFIPQGQGGNWGSAAIPHIRAMLNRNGVTSPIVTRPYPVIGNGMDQPIRLSFNRLKAQVATQCGQWPQDLATPGLKEGISNRSHYNYGCAYQQNLAQQVDDPLDLVRPRTEGQIDTARRVQVIETRRRGEDAATIYRSGAPNINGAVGGNN